MREFIIRVLKWLAALVTACFLFLLIVFILLIGIGTLFQAKPVALEKDSILVLDLGFNLTDAPKAEDFAKIIRGALEGEIPGAASLHETINGLKTARQDSHIAGLLIAGNLADGSGSSFAGLRELRRAIRAFSEEKPVWAYVGGDSLRDIYLKSAAGEVISNPYGSVDFRGLQAEQIYLGGAFERIGIEVQVEAFEEFKTAADPFQKTGMSEADKLQLNSLLEDFWSVILHDIAEARELDPKALDAVAANELVVFGEEIPATGLADRQMSEDEFIEHLTAESAYDNQARTFRQIDFLEYLRKVSPSVPRMAIAGQGNKVAVIYADGIIVDGESGDSSVGSAELVRHLREARFDDSIKAVVLRINSPGGSATASFKVVREIQLTNARKPVVASMGGIAASAGYMLSAACEQIYSEPSTITGSIGVVMILPNIEKMAEKLMINFEGVGTHPFSGTYSLAHSKTPEEMAQVRALGRAFYRDFIALVASGRGMEADSVRNVAGGRVWSGLSALENGLADEEGGLSAAIQRAADLAAIGDDYQILERPRKMTFEEQIEDILTYSGISRVKAARQGVLEQAWTDLQAEMHRLSLLNDPHAQYAILPYSLKIR